MFDAHFVPSFVWQDHALEELATFLQSEIVEKAPLANVLLSESWVPDRVNAARVSCAGPARLYSDADAIKQFVAGAVCLKSLRRWVCSLTFRWST